MNGKTPIFDLQPHRLDSITPLQREDTSVIEDDAFDTADIPDSEQSHNEITLSSFNQNQEPRFFPLKAIRRSQLNMTFPSYSPLRARKNVSLENETHKIKIQKIGSDGTILV